MLMCSSIFNLHPIQCRITLIHVDTDEMETGGWKCIKTFEVDVTFEVFKEDVSLKGPETSSTSCKHKQPVNLFTSGFRSGWHASVLCSFELFTNTVTHLKNMVKSLFLLRIRRG